MESVFRFMKGYLVILISKQGFVRCLNLCVHDRLNIWNIVEQEKYVQLNITLQDFRHIQEIVRKSKVKVKILRRIGLPFLLIKMRKYVILYIGIIICLIFLYYQKTHLWTVRTEGNVSITFEQIEDCLRENGFYAGMPATHFKAAETERLLKESFEMISWVCASLDGTELVISVIENTASVPHTISDELPSSLYAAKDGIIQKLVVNKGYTEKEVMEEVRAGDLLISGEVPYDLNDGTKAFYLTYAQGDYLCEIQIPYYKAYKRMQNKPQYDMWESSFYILHFGKVFTPDISFGSSKEQEVILREYIDLNFLSVFDCNSHLILKKRKPYLLENTEYGTEELKELLYKDLSYLLKEIEESGAEKILPDVSFLENKNEVILFGTIKYYDSEMLRKNISPQTDGSTEYGTGNTDNGT